MPQVRPTLPNHNNANHRHTRNNNHNLNTDSTKHRYLQTLELPYKNTISTQSSTPRSQRTPTTKPPKLTSKLPLQLTQHTQPKENTQSYQQKLILDSNRSQLAPHHIAPKLEDCHRHDIGSEENPTAIEQPKFRCSLVNPHQISPNTATKSLRRQTLPKAPNRAHHTPTKPTSSSSTTYPTTTPT